jgi:hypothetical protein
MGACSVGPVAPHLRMGPDPVPEMLRLAFGISDNGHSPEML